LKNNTALFIFIFFCSLYCLFSIGHFGGDGYEDYLTAESIVLDGDLELYDRPLDEDQLKYKTDAGIPGRGGKIYSSRGSLVMPGLMAPFYAIGHTAASFLDGVPHDMVTILAVSFYNPFMTALNVMLIFLLSRRTGFSSGTGVVLSFVYGLSTMAPVYARTGFAEPTLSFFLLLSVLFVFRYESSPSAGKVFPAAVFAVIAFLSKASAVIFVPVLYLYFLAVTLIEQKDTAGRVLHNSIYISALLAGILGLFSFNYLIYGNAFSIGAYDISHNASRIASSSHFLKGLYYYLLSTGKGFFFYNLPLLLVFPAVFLAYREKKRKAFLFAGIFILNLVFYVKSFRRGSLYSWGPRYLLPSVPFMVLLCGFYIDRIKKVSGRLLVWVLSVAGFLVMLPCMFVNQSKFYFFVVERLGLREYMINFIPDLSPIKGAWHMFISRLFIPGMEFVYAPDWRLVEPVSYPTSGYDYLDIWFSKTLAIAPSFTLPVTAAVLFLVFMVIFSFLALVRSLRL
jgi:hypothetical protein